MALTDFDLNAICEVCHKAAYLHDDWQQADFHRKMAAEARERAEFDAKVAHRAVEIAAERRRVNALVEYKMAKAHGIAWPRPRTDSLDQLEVARVVAYEREKSYQQLVARKVHEMKMASGTGSLVDCPANAPSREVWFNGGTSVKDAPADDRFETTDAF